MSDELFENTKMAAYYLWEYTGCNNALSLWYCAEDLAVYFEKKNYFSPSDLTDILQESVYDIRRVAFVRHIAFRIFVYTAKHDKLTNWYSAEKLVTNPEWLASVCKIARIYHEYKNDFSKLTGVRSEQVKQYYREFN